MFHPCHGITGRSNMLGFSDNLGNLQAHSEIWETRALLTASYNRN